jgi:class 3 adenylate cyclase
LVFTPVRRWWATSAAAVSSITPPIDTINTAARLEAANKFLGTRICVTAAAADGATEFRGRPVGDLMLRGRSVPLRAY